MPICTSSLLQYNDQFLPVKPSDAFLLKGCLIIKCKVLIYFDLVSQKCAENNYTLPLMGSFHLTLSFVSVSWVF